MSDHISHVGIAVCDIDRAIETFRKICPDLKVAERREVPDQDVEVCFLEFPGSGGAGRLELLLGTTANSPIRKFIDKRGEGIHHICFSCASVSERLTELRELGVALIDETPRVGALGKNIAFLKPSSAHGVLIELEEE